MSRETNHKEPGTAHRSEVLVRVENVSKIFCRDLKKSLLYGLKDCAKDLVSWGKNKEQGTKQQEQGPRSMRADEFYAVNNVSFELRRGECLGLIGRNGAGKTTLLKMLNGLIKPDHGRIEMRGRVRALIALGAGFNPILSGRENIYVNGSILGLTKNEIDAKIDEIIDFAEIGEFIDAPVQSYSSGMQVRLGFAVATAMEPDVLILDEVLAVGDAAFRTKCYNRISELLKNCAVIFVSHSEEQLLRICQYGLVLNSSATTGICQITAALEQYRKLQGTAGSQASGLDYKHPSIKLVEFTVKNSIHESGEDLILTLTYFSSEKFELAIHVLCLIKQGGIGSAAINLLPIASEIPAGETTLRFRVKNLCLRPGSYQFTIEITEKNHATTLARLLFDPSIETTGSIIHWCDYTPIACK